MKLVKPHKKYLSSYVAAIEEGFPIGGCSDDPSFVSNNFDKHIIKISRPRELWNDGIYREDVKFDRYWMVDNDLFIGHVVIRNQMNDFHRIVGGNIGYRVRKSCYNKGYASKALKQALDICKANDMNEVLITCYDDNFASIRVIEKNHGILKDKVEIDWLDKIVRRYIVKL